MSRSIIMITFVTILIAFIFIINITHAQHLRQPPTTITSQQNIIDEDPIITVPLHGSHGSHHAYLYVGSPPQRQALIVDTGSHYTAFPCEPCLSCGKHISETYFDPSGSSTDEPSSCRRNGCEWTGVSKCHEDQCRLTQRYTEGSSWTAYELKDLAWLGSDDVNESVRNHERMAVPFVFGCQMTESGLFRTQYADGIMGLTMDPHSILSSFYNHGSLPHRSFSLCLARTDGTLSLGGYRTSHHLQPLQFTPLKPHRNLYTIRITNFFLNDIEIDRVAVVRAFNAGRGTVVDSGTTDTYLPVAVSRLVWMTWEREMGDVKRLKGSYSNVRQELTWEEFQMLPTMTIVMVGGAKWVLRPEYYFEPVMSFEQQKGERQGGMGDGGGEKWKGTRVFTNRVYFDEPTGAVLGANTMMGHDVFFDVDNLRFGIARANCVYNAVKDG